MAANGTICIVDDDGPSLNAIASLLTASGFDVQTFTSAETFLENCLAQTLHEFGCLVLDVRLPGMSGLELQEHLKKLDIQIPVVLISGHASEEVKELGLSNGATTLLEKPFSGHRLVEEVKKAIGAA